MLSFLFMLGCNSVMVHEVPESYNLKKLRKEIDSELPKPFTSLFDFYRKVLPSVVALATNPDKYYKVKLNN